MLGILILSSTSTTHDSQFSSWLNQSSGKVCSTEAGDGNFSHDYISEVIDENVDYATDAHDSKLLDSMTSQSPNA